MNWHFLVNVCDKTKSASIVFVLDKIDRDKMFIGRVVPKAMLLCSTGWIPIHEFEVSPNGHGNLIVLAKTFPFSTFLVREDKFVAQYPRYAYVMEEL